VSTNEELQELIDGIAVPEDGHVVVALILPDQLWALAADLAAAPPSKGRWEFSIEDVPLTEAVARYKSWLAFKREQGHVA